MNSPGRSKVRQDVQDRGSGVGGGLPPSGHISNVALCFTVLENRFDHLRAGMCVEVHINFSKKSAEPHLHHVSQFTVVQTASSLVLIHAFLPSPLHWKVITVANAIHPLAGLNTSNWF